MGILMVFFVVPMLFHVISMVFLWGFCRIPMRFPWYFYDIFWGYYWIYGMSIIFLWDSYGGSKGCLCDFHWIPMRLP